MRRLAVGGGGGGGEDGMGGGKEGYKERDESGAAGTREVRGEECKARGATSEKGWRAGERRRSEGQDVRKGERKGRETRAEKRERREIEDLLDWMIVTKGLQRAGGAQGTGSAGSAGKTRQRRAKQGRGGADYPWGAPFNASTTGTYWSQRRRGRRI